MAQDGDQRDYYRWQGRIEERVNNKAGRSELSDLYNQTQEEIRKSEQRGRDLVAASSDGLRREITTVKNTVEKNGREAQQIGAELHSFITNMNADNHAKQASLEAIQKKLEERQIDWQKWIQTLVLIFAVIMMIITQNWADLLKVRF